ncbi:methylthioribulose 1-phosphate dehydratase [Synchytrium endobioticum]|uniref:Methylthioribulose-1-phosphate dehydratase n=1 Tax=Synchytrium endobioticum TaxID=286115 RepID=A0A507DF00_9FUNG|nr:methylthioribulose 1-phosphate dehydratase [Synchytrium endobioticum]
MATTSVFAVLRIWSDWCLQYCECCFPRRRQSGLYEPLLAESERSSIAQLLRLLEGDREGVDFFGGEAIKALGILASSDSIELQRSAALAFAEVTEQDIRAVDRPSLEPLMSLLSSDDTEVQRAVAAALGNLATNADNKILMVQMGVLGLLTNLLQSSNLEVQCNAVGCLTNLATSDENKVKIGQSGALIPLVRLARSRDIRVQRNAAGALLNMTHDAENRQELVLSGAVPVLVSLLDSPDLDIKFFATTSLSNLAVDAATRRKLSQNETRLVPALIRLMDEQSLRVQCQSVLALRNLASDDGFQPAIVKHGGLSPLLKVLHSTTPQLALAAAACVRNLSIHPENESALMDAGFVSPLIDLLSCDQEEVIARRQPNPTNTMAPQHADAPAPALTPTLAADDALSSDPEHPLNLIPELCRLFYKLGWVTGTGGGITIKHGDRIYIAPSGVQKERMRASHLYILPATPTFPVPGALRAPPGLAMSQCTPLFWTAYTMRAAGAVIHTHSQHAVMASLLCRGSVFRITHQEMIKGIRKTRDRRNHWFWETVEVPVVENTAEEEDLKDRMAVAMQQYPDSCAVLVRRHGVYVWGDTWQKAKTMTECYDYLFEIAVKMQQLNMDPAMVPHDSEYRDQCSAIHQHQHATS